MNGTTERTNAAVTIFNRQARHETYYGSDLHLLVNVDTISLG
jgi:hypothetical protein